MKRRPAARRIGWRRVRFTLLGFDIVAALLAAGAALDRTGLHAWIIVVAAPIALFLAMHACGAYSRAATALGVPPRTLLRAWLLAIGALAVLATLLATAWGRELSPAPDSLLTGVAGLLAGTLLPRYLLAAARRRRLIGPIVLGRAVVVGSGAPVIRTLDHLAASTDATFDIAGVLDSNPQPGRRIIGGAPILGRADQVVAVVGQSDIDAVIVVLPWTEQTRAASLLARTRLPVDVLLALDERAPDVDGRVASAAVGISGLAQAGRPPISGLDAVLKRAMDVALSATLLVLLSPVLASIALLIKLDTSGPVLFRQRRYGFNRHVFQMCKFRSMANEAADADAARQTSRQDARLTRIGAILRRHSLDELPQLLNVLHGTMSIVGPRPHALGTRTGGQLLEDALDRYVARSRVKPGITGWAQVNGSRGELSTMERLEQRVDLDLHYIDDWSLMLDLKILALTVRCAIHDRAAY